MNIQNSGSNKRTEHRIHSNQLPESLKSMILQFENGTQITVNTLDASKTGIGLRVPLPVYSITDFYVTLSPKDKSFQIKDELLYIKPIDKDSSRVSIKFSQSANLQKYKQLLK